MRVSFACASCTASTASRSLRDALASRDSRSSSRRAASSRASLRSSCACRAALIREALHRLVVGELDPLLVGEGDSVARLPHAGQLCLRVLHRQHSIPLTEGRVGEPGLQVLKPPCRVLAGVVEVLLRLPRGPLRVDEGFLSTAHLVEGLLLPVRSLLHRIREGLPGGPYLVGGPLIRLSRATDSVGDALL